MMEMRHQGCFGTYLVLDEKLDTLDRSSGSLRDGGGNTTHCYACQLTGYAAVYRH
jgi:hypothetical protein